MADRDKSADPKLPKSEQAPTQTKPSTTRTSEATDGEELNEKKQVLKSATLKSIAEYIKSEKCKNIITMAGAGISTSAGIPDFRSPGSGLYDNLQKYNLPNPQSIFEIHFFLEHPEPFFQLAKELWPGTFKPTPCHYFLKMLSEEGLLFRHYTQNIDTLEHVAGIPSEKIVEAHGTFHTAHCVKCGKSYTQDWVKEQIFKGANDSDPVPHCEKDDCDGIVKPDIVFFGEALPERFFRCVESDFSKADLLIVMGTSLLVQPFASLINRVPDTCPRLYINRERTDKGDDLSAFLMELSIGGGFDFDSKGNTRDVFKQGDCDMGCQELAKLLGWETQLSSIVKEEHSRIDNENSKSQAAVKDEKSGVKQTVQSPSKKKVSTKSQGTIKDKKSAVKETVPSPSKKQVSTKSHGTVKDKKSAVKETVPSPSKKKVSTKSRDTAKENTDKKAGL